MLTILGYLADGREPLCRDIADHLDRHDDTRARRPYLEAAHHGALAAWMRLADLCERLNDPAAAEEAAQSAAAVGFADAWMRLGQIRERRGDTRRAEQAYQEAALTGSRAAWAQVARLREWGGDHVGVQRAALAAHLDVTG